MLEDAVLAVCLQRGSGPGYGDAPWPPSCVPAVQQCPGDGVHDGDEQAHHAEAGPGLQGVGGVVDASELASGLGRPELGDLVPPRVRQCLGDPGQDEQDGDHAGDGHPRLADPGRVPAQLGGDAEPGVGVGGDRADDGPQGDAEHDGRGQRPERRPDRTELDPLRAQHVGEGGCAERRLVARGGAGDRCAGHRVPPAAWYSTLSRVSSMNASSSEARTGMSSNKTMPWAAASSAAWGLRTCTDCWELDRTNSSTLVSAISWPLPITSRWPAVRAISLIRWLETSTVRPSAARSRMRVRTEWMPSGSRPLTGSSKMSTAGSPSSADAMPSR